MAAGDDHNASENGEISAPESESHTGKIMLKPNGVLCFFMVLFSSQLVAAGYTLIPDDSNSRIVVENAVVTGNETTLFFYTWPYLGDPNSGKPCPLNYYSVKLNPGLPSAHADVVAKGVCGAGMFEKSRLLDNGDALIIVRDRLERWRTGAKINSQTFSSIDAVSKLGVTTDMTGGQFYDISPQGDVVLLIQSGDPSYDREEYRGSSMVMAGLKPDGGRRWEQRFSGNPALTTVKQLWAGPGGSALLHTSFLSSGLADAASQLHFVSADGSRIAFNLNEIGEPLDIQRLSNMPQEDVMKLLAQQNKSRPESIEKLEAVARTDGGFDVLFNRKGGEQGREGYFLYRIGPAGSLLSQIPLGNHILEHGLEHWFDFYVDSKQLVLLSRVFATQQGVQAKRKGWMQTVVSRIDLDTGMPVSRLIPLDRQYLEAAMNAGDAEMQYLDGLPGGEPALLTSLGGIPLSVTLGSVAHHPTLRINEATDQLMPYTEAYDEKQAEIAKKEASKQRTANRDARQREMNADMATATGMTPEAFAALSNKERKQAMVRNGDLDAIMAAVMKQGQQSATASGATPEQAAQMQASMAQVQQMMQAGGAGMTGNNESLTLPPAQTSAQAAEPEAILSVDSLMRGHIQYKNANGKVTTLRLINRQTDEELLKKVYADGVIDEYVSFGRYKLPIEQIGVLIKNSRDEVLEDLTPEVNK